MKIFKLKLKRRETGGDRGRPGETGGDRGRPGETGGDWGRPGETKGDRRRPRETRRDQGRPLGHCWGTAQLIATSAWERQYWGVGL